MLPLVLLTALKADLNCRAAELFMAQLSFRKPLQPPYDGPYKVVNRKHKYFTLEIHGKTDTVSIDRLKPAHSDCNIDPLTPPPPSTLLTPTPTQCTPPSFLPEPLVQDVMFIGLTIICHLSHPLLYFIYFRAHGVR